MVEHGDEHRRHTVEAGDALLIDAGERDLGREIRHRAERRAVRHAGGHGEHHAEAVEHRHLNHHPVGRGQIHPVADAFAVVDDVVVRQHDALREARRTGGVLHVAHVVRPHARGHAQDLFARDHIGPIHRLVEGQAARHPEADGDDAAQERQLAAVQGGAGLCVGQLRAEGLDDLTVVRVQTVVNHDERVRVGLPQQIFRLVDLVRRVDRDEHGADLRCGPEGDEPCGHVRGPDGDLAAPAHAERDERAGKIVHVVAELRVGSRVVERRVFERVLVREFLDHPVEHLREGLGDEAVLLPDELAGMRGVVIERLFLAARRVEAVHVVHEMRENDLRVGQVGHPFRLPLERDEPVIVDGGQRLHHAADGQRALADEVIAAVVVRVAQVDVADVGAEVFDGRVGGFAVVPVGMVHVPERAQLIAGERVEQRAQPGRVGKDAAGLEQDRDPLRLGGGEERFERGGDPRVVIAPCGHGDIRTLHVVRQLHEGGHGLSAVLARDVAGSIEARDAQALLPELPRRRGGGIAVQRAAAAGQLRRFVDVIELDAAEAHGLGHLHLLLPGDLLPAACGKRYIHVLLPPQAFAASS